MKLWMAIENDSFRLPLYVADTAEELAEMFHVKRSTVVAENSHYKQRKKEYRYIAVEVDDE